MKRKAILLIGLGRFGKHIAVKLNELGHEVLAVDTDGDKVDSMLPYITNGQIGDSTNEAFLRSLDIKSFDCCIVTVSGDFQSSLETTYLLRELGAKRIISRAERDGQAKFLLRNGADEIVYPEKQLAYQTAIKCSADNILDYIELDENNSIFETDIPEAWIGKSISELNIRRKYGISILGVKRNGGVMNINIPADKVFEPEETLLILGDYKSVSKCFK